MFGHNVRSAWPTVAYRHVFRVAHLGRSDSAGAFVAFAWCLIRVFPVMDSEVSSALRLGEGTSRRIRAWRSEKNA